MPWLLWGFDRQTWRDRELVIVDSSPSPYLSDRPDVRVIRAPPGTNVPAKRNLALAAATGTLVAWFDDDDWHHPQRLALLAEALFADPRVGFAGGTRSFFVDLHGDTCRSYEGYGTIIFNGAGFRREIAQAVRFNEAQRRASDTGWMQALSARGGHRVVAPQILSAWLSHEQNISNDRRRWRFPLPLSTLRGEIGAAMWGDTDERIAALRTELPSVGLLPVMFPIDRRVSIQPRAQHKAIRLRQLLSHSARRYPNRLADQVRRDSGRVAPAEANARKGAPKAGVGPNAPYAVVVCFFRGEATQAAALLPNLARQVGSTPRNAIAVLCGERQGTDASVADLAAWDSVVSASSAPGAPDGRAETVITRESLLAVVERTEGADWLLLVDGCGSIVHPGQIGWVEPTLSRLRADADLVAVGIPTGGGRGARGAARGAPLGLPGATWDNRLRLWRSRKVTGLVFVADHERLREALRTQINGPDRAGALATVLDGVLCAARVEKAFGTLATKEAWTRGAGAWLTADRDVRAL